MRKYVWVAGLNSEANKRLKQLEGLAVLHLLLFEPDPQFLDPRKPRSRENGPRKEAPLVESYHFGRFWRWKDKPYESVSCTQIRHQCFHAPTDNDELCFRFVQKKFSKEYKATVRN